MTTLALLPDTASPLSRESAAQAFADLLDVASVDELITSRALRHPAFRLVQDGDTLPRAGYTTSRRWGATRYEGVIDPARAVAVVGMVVAASRITPPTASGSETAQRRTRQQVQVAERQIDVQRSELDSTIIRAPFSGIVISKDAQPGEMVSPVSAGGGFTRTGIGTIVDMRSLEIDVDGAEIEDAQWYTRDDIRTGLASGELMLPGGVSISHRLIQAWYGEPLDSSW